MAETRPQCSRARAKASATASAAYLDVTSDEHHRRHETSVLLVVPLTEGIGDSFVSRRRPHSRYLMHHIYKSQGARNAGSACTALVRETVATTLRAILANP